MAEQVIDALVDAGKASAGPPLGPALGPMGVNIGEVIKTINEKTSGFAGMQVPIKVIVDTDTKKFKITIGTPPSSSLIMKEAGIKKGSGNPNTDRVADVLIEQIIKVALMKSDALLGKTLKEKVKEIIGTCNSMGVLVEGKPAVDAIKLVNEGKFDKEIKEEKTELSAEEKKNLDEEKKKLAADIETRRAEFVKTANELIKSMEGKPRGSIKTKLVEAKIPVEIIDELLPVEGAEGAVAGDKKEAAPAAEAKK